MPLLPFALMLLAVIVTAAATIALLSLGGPSFMVATLPTFLLAALALKALRR